MDSRKDGILEDYDRFGEENKDEGGDDRLRDDETNENKYNDNSNPISPQKQNQNQNNMNQVGQDNQGLNSNPSEKKNDSNQDSSMPGQQEDIKKVNPIGNNNQNYPNLDDSNKIITNPFNNQEEPKNQESSNPDSNPKINEQNTNQITNQYPNLDEKNKNKNEEPAKNSLSDNLNKDKNKENKIQGNSEQNNNNFSNISNNISGNLNILSQNNVIEQNFNLLPPNSKDNNSKITPNINNVNNNQNMQNNLKINQFSNFNNDNMNSNINSNINQNFNSNINSKINQNINSNNNNINNINNINNNNNINSNIALNQMNQIGNNQISNINNQGNNFGVGVQIGNQNNINDKNNQNNILNNNNQMNMNMNVNVMNKKIMGMQNQNVNQNVNQNNNLQPYSFARYKKASKTGLKNLGDTSYFNSVLQMLGSVRNLSSYFLNPKTQKTLEDDVKQKEKSYFSYVFHRLFLHLYPYPERIGAVYEPGVLLEVLGKLNPVYSTTERRNPNQLIYFFLYQLHKELNSKNTSYITKTNSLDKNRVIKQKMDDFAASNNSIISNSFYWFEFKTKLCSGCNNNFYELNTFETLELDIQGAYNKFQNTITIPQCLLFQSQKVQNSFCQICHNYKNFNINTRIYSSPFYFIFSLNRGNPDQNLLGINFLIQDEIDISPFLENKNSISKYDLIGIVSISIKENFKYVCFGRSPVDKKWYLYNDEKVNEVILAQVTQLNNNMEYVPCILLYQYKK